ncbi:MAG: hypothetical protein AAFW98_01825 [Pseudomonadota bacterium]
MAPVGAAAFGLRGFAGAEAARLAAAAAAAAAAGLAGFALPGFTAAREGCGAALSLAFAAAFAPAFAVRAGVTFSRPSDFGGANAKLLWPSSSDAGPYGRNDMNGTLMV